MAAEESLTSLILTCQAVTPGPGHLPSFPSHLLLTLLHDPATLATFISAPGSLHLLLLLFLHFFAFAVLEGPQKPFLHLPSLSKGPVTHCLPSHP